MSINEEKKKSARTEIEKLMSRLEFSSKMFKFSTLYMNCEYEKAFKCGTELYEETCKKKDYHYDFEMRHYIAQVEIQRGNLHKALRIALELISDFEKPEYNKTDRRFCPYFNLFSAYQDIDSEGYADELYSRFTKMLEIMPENCICQKCYTGMYLSIISIEKILTVERVYDFLEDRKDTLRETTKYKAEGIIAYLQGLFDEAMRKFDISYEKAQYDFDRSSALYWKASCAKKMGNSNLSLKFYDAILNLRSLNEGNVASNIHAHFEKFMTYRETNEIAQAYKEARTTLKLCEGKGWIAKEMEIKVWLLENSSKLDIHKFEKEKLSQDVKNLFSKEKTLSRFSKRIINLEIPDSEKLSG